MRKSNFVFLAAVLVLLSACSGTNYWKLRIKLPTKVDLSLAEYETMVVTNFLVKNDDLDFDINKELDEYFSYEFKQALEKEVESETVPLETDEDLDDPNFWRELFPDKKKTVLLTGSVEYTQEIRKALLKDDKRRFEDPFPSERKLAQRTFYSLLLDLYLVDSSSGEVIYKKNFKETRAYKNPNQTAYFAFFDLMQVVKDKMVNSLLGGERVQQRYLITK